MDEKTTAQNVDNPDVVAFDEEDEIFSWWATDPSDKKITVEHQPGGDVEVYDVETAAGLYEYLYDMYHKE